MRNAIVHNSKIGDRAIAEPHHETLQLLIDIHAKISNPKKVIPLFKFDVFGANKNDFVFYHRLFCGWSDTKFRWSGGKNC